MKKVRLSYVRWLILTILFCFVLFASISSEIGEWYAIYLYPGISKIISFISSTIPFSLDEWTILAFIFLLISYPIYGRIQKKKKWLQIISVEIEIIMWIYVWFYWGWGMNYYRESFYQRTDVKPITYDKVKFDAFLTDFSNGMKQAYRECQSIGLAQSSDLFRPMNDLTQLASIHNEIKSIYKRIPRKYGLTVPTSYQHPKYPSFNSVYSNVGVLGFMGPFFAESHVNQELSMLEYPFTYAHELSHLLGISSEAEANLWAYIVCLQSSRPLIRFSGYIGLLSYVRANAMYLLSPSDFEAWDFSLSPDIHAINYRIHAYWILRYNHTLGEIQSEIYTFFLKRNKISSGQKNYAQVVGMLLALPNIEILIGKNCE